MSLQLLIASPADTKLFVDLAASCLYAKRIHPDLAVDILVDGGTVPNWWTFSADWFRILSDLADAKPQYSLITQLHPDPSLARQLAKVTSDHRSGVVFNEDTFVNGRWAQVFLGQLGSRRFGPFSAHDLFNHVILGRTAPHAPAVSNTASKGDWVVDLDSLPIAQKILGEDLLTQLSFAHPGKTKADVSTPVDPASISAYVGCNIPLASWLAFHGVPVVLLHEQEFEPSMIVASPHAWYQRISPALTVGQIISLLKNTGLSVGGQRYTDEYLGGLAPVLNEQTAENSTQIFDHLHYVVFNYLNDLREVDLPIPQVNAASCLHLKGAASVLGKLIHLNQFGMKFLQEFLAKVETGAVIDKDVQEISQRIQEIDELTERTFIAYPDFDLYRYVLKFAKASAQGNNIVEISKSLMLVLHESNQTMQVYSELIETIVRNHSRPIEAPGA